MGACDECKKQRSLNISRNVTTILSRGLGDLLNNYLFRLLGGKHSTHLDFIANMNDVTSKNAAGNKICDKRLHVVCRAVKHIVHESRVPRVAQS